MRDVKFEGGRAFPSPRDNGGDRRKNSRSRLTRRWKKGDSLSLSRGGAAFDLKATTWRVDSIPASKSIFSVETPRKSTVPSNSVHCARAPA
jgi:hypothetical protein